MSEPHSTSQKFLFKEINEVYVENKTQLELTYQQRQESIMHESVKKIVMEE